MALEKCPKCGRMHYRTDPCIVAKDWPPRTIALRPDDKVLMPDGRVTTVSVVAAAQRGDRHTPGYMAAYMREWRKRQK